MTNDANISFIIIIQKYIRKYIIIKKIYGGKIEFGIKMANVMNVKNIKYL